LTVRRNISGWVRLASTLFQANVATAPKPYKLTFVVTKRCHSQCVYCDIWKAKDDPRAMARELTLTEVTAVARANPYFQWIDFTGGEPTDRPDFIQVVQAFSDHCPQLLLVHFPTNGIATRKIVQITRALTSSLRARLVVTVSIDGPPEINDRLRGIRNDFKHAIATYAEVREIIGDNVYVGMTLHGHTGNCGSSSSELVVRTFDAINTHLIGDGRKGIDWPQFHVNIPHLSEHYYNNVANPTVTAKSAQRGELIAAVRMLLERNGASASPMRVLERIYRKQALRYLENGRTPVPCEALSSTVYLSEHGEVFPCSIWNRPLGNVRATSYNLMSLVKQARDSGLRSQIVNGKCPHCWTPCEAYPAIAGNALRAVGQSIKHPHGSAGVAAKDEGVMLAPSGTSPRGDEVKCTRSVATGG
jgi:MoaA/NifB/PqqE/SkfB family radical SAM enzyme